jgi:hypothetical protein
VNLRAVRHFKLDQDVVRDDGFGVARMVLIVGDSNSILRYDPCAVTSDDGQCFEQSGKWIDMSISNYEDFYGDLYDVHLFDPVLGIDPSRNDRPALAYAVGKFIGRDGVNYPYTRLNAPFGQMVILRLTAHGQKHPQNSPHGWAARPTHTCNDPNAYGCWTIVTPPWTEGQNFLIGFSQNQASADEIPTCCTISTVRCVFPDDFVSCYPWPTELAVGAAPNHRSMPMPLHLRAPPSRAAMSDDATILLCGAGPQYCFAQDQVCY